MADVAAKVKLYIQLRNQLDAARKEYQEIEKDFKQKLEDIQFEILNISDELGVDSLKTEFGTAYRTVKSSYRIISWEDYLDWAEKNGALHTLQKRVTKTAVDEIVQEDLNGELPPGLDLYSEVTINVRKN
jgi:hypothetical protein